MARDRRYLSLPLSDAERFYRYKISIANSSPKKSFGDRRQRNVLDARGNYPEVRAHVHPQRFTYAVRYQIRHQTFDLKGQKGTVTVWWDRRGPVAPSSLDNI